MQRRTFLGGLATGVVAVSGCIGGGTDGGDGSDGDDGSDGRDGPPGAGPTSTERRPPDTDRATPVPPDTAEPSPRGPSDTPGTGPGPSSGFVTEAFAAPELVAPNSPDSFGVDGRTGSNAPPAVEDVALTASGDSFTATTDVGYGTYALFDRGGAYRPSDDPRGWVVFRLPKPLDATDATVSWPAGEYALDGDLVGSLSRPPTTFEVRAFEAPAAAEFGDTVTATVRVANTGDVDGTFVAAVNRVGPLIAYAPAAAVRLPVPAGETVAWRYEHTIDHTPAEDRPMRIHLLWRDGDLSRQVTVRGTGTATDDDAPAGTATDGERER